LSESSAYDRSRFDLDFFEKFSEIDVSLADIELYDRVIGKLDELEDLHDTHLPVAAQSLYALELVEEAEDRQVWYMLPMLVVVRVRDIWIVLVRPLDKQIEPPAQRTELRKVHDVEELEYRYQDPVVMFALQSLTVLCDLVLLFSLDLRLEVF